MQINLTTTGLLNPSGLRAWIKGRDNLNRKNVREGMLAASPKLTKLVRDAASAGLHIKRKTFLNVFKTKLWARDRTRFPQLQLFASKRVRWLDIQETGGTISGHMVIPLLPEGQRMSRKAFTALLAKLSALGLLFYKREGDRTLIFAQNPSAKAKVSGLAKFRKGARMAGFSPQGGAQRLTAGKPVLIGIILRHVTLRARLGFQKAAKLGAAIVAAEIQTAIAKNEV